jgi:hypothetical protein
MRICAMSAGYAACGLAALLLAAIRHDTTVEDIGQ